MTHNPFAPPPQPSPPPSRWLGESDFAAAFDLVLDTTVTLNWKLMNVEHDVPRAFGNFLKCLRAWLVEHHIPPAWLYVHERGEVVGVHTHLILYVPGVPSADPPWKECYRPDMAPDYRSDFRAWARG